MVNPPIPTPSTMSSTKLNNLLFLPAHERLNSASSSGSVPKFSSLCEKLVV
jgi:hypothetical protein